MTLLSADDNLELLVEQDSPVQASFVSTPLPGLAPGEVLLRIEKFGFTANNMTYVMLGKALRFSEFFPAPDPRRHAKIPVWGVATVAASTDERLQEGERIYGCFPLARYVTLKPSSVDRAQFQEERPHLPPEYSLYGQYHRATADPLYTAEHEDAMLVFRPLWLTGFLLDDFLAENTCFGAKTIMISSASSKTALGLADLLTRGRAARVVGLTSAGNAAFVRGLGVYTEVVTYDQIDGLSADDGAVLVDIAGNPKVVAALHARLGDRLKALIIVGKTHRGSPAANPAQPAPPIEPNAFFAPGWARKRGKELGPELGRRIGVAWTEMLSRVDSWVKVRRGNGPAAVLKVYEGMLAGKAEPEAADVLSLWDAPAEPKL